MGEAPAFVADDLKGAFDVSLPLKSMGLETAVDIDCRTYVIGASENTSISTIEVRFFDKLTNTWITPIVLGTKPELSQGHSAIAVNEDRILVIRGNTSSDDSFWFLEVDTEFVKTHKRRSGTEVVAWSKGRMGEAEKPIVISGPSGVGKGTLISRLMEEFPSMFGFSVSHTTRGPRVNEQNGVHYHFTERSVMEKDIQDGKFLEFASVHGNLYGTSVEAVEVVADQGKTCILDIDVQGARSVRAGSLEAVFIFICPPSFEDLEKRLRARATETEEQIQKRLKNAKAELEQGQSPGLFDHILVNDNLDECYAKLKELLGLTDGVKNINKHGLQLISVPVEHTLSKTDGKTIILTCCGAEQESTSTKMLVVDLGSIKGGAPGRTRGLRILAAGTQMNGSTGDNPTHI